jgi:hypothetical protein
MDHRRDENTLDISIFSCCELEKEASGKLCRKTRDFLLHQCQNNKITSLPYKKVQFAKIC